MVSDEAHAAREEQERLKKRDSAIRRLVADAGLRTSSCRLTNFQVKTKYQKTVVNAVAEWIETFPKRRQAGEGLVLYGPVGTGKDHLLFSAVGQVVFDHFLSCKWINGRELVGTIRDRIKDDQNEGGLIATLAAPDILVISDPLPPIGDLKEHQADMLYRICEVRYGARKITAVTLNVASDEEADKRLGCATWDRLCHGAWKIACMWETHRKPSRDLRPM